MDLFDAIRTRTSIRKFKPDAVPDQDLRTMIDLATRAPSAGNTQMWRFLAVSNRRLLEKMREIVLRKLDEVSSWPEAQPYEASLCTAKGYSSFFADAPVTIVVLGRPYQSAVDSILEARGWDRPGIDALRQKPDIQSVAAAIQNLSLAAHAMGYGACWMTAPCIAGPELKELLDVQPPWEIIALVPLGIPDEEPHARPRKLLEEVLEFVR